MRSSIVPVFVALLPSVFGQMPDTAVLDFTLGNQNTLGAGENDKVVGWKFEIVNLQPNERLKVVDLGYWISGPMAVNVVDHPITIWDDNGPNGMPVAVAQTIVTPMRAPKQNGGLTSQWFRWRGLNQIAGGTLEPGKTYTIAAFYPRPNGMPMNPGDPWVSNPMMIQWDPRVSFIQDAYTNANAGNVYPNQTNGMGSTPLFGPNFKFEVEVAVMQSVCPGDGSYPSNDPMNCPCGNTSPSGARQGCLNSTGTNGGTLRDASGSSASLSTDALRLDATHPPGNSGILLVNTAIFSTGIALFDGLACVGGGPRVLPGADNGLSQPFGDVDLVAFDGVRNLGGTVPGTGFYGLVSATFPGYFSPGGTYYAQFWYRDVLCGPPPTPCSTVCTVPPPGAANFTNAVSWIVTP
jgi:hypothetical protein